MIVTAVTVFVKEDHIQDFIEATIKNHEGSVEEPGNLRFDILQSKDDPARFLFYEVYESEDAVAQHKKTVHYLEWRETVEAWMAKPRCGVPHDVIRPEAINSWR